MNSRAKLLRNLILLTLTTTALAAVANLISPNRDDTVLQVRTLRERGDTIEAISINNSHNLALDWEAMGLNGYHLWRGGGDVIEGEHQVDVLLADLPNLEYVFVPLSYFTLYNDNGAYRREDDPRHREIHYASLPGWSYIKGDFGSFVRGKADNFPLRRMVRIDHWESDLKRLVAIATGNQTFNATAPLETQTDLIRIILRNTADPWAACFHYDSAELDEKARDPNRSQVLKHLRNQDAMLAAEPDVVHKTTDSLTRLHQLLDEQGIRLILYTPPYAQIYTQLYDPAYIDVLVDTVRQLQTNYGVEYYDFSTDPDYVTRVDWFLDEDHLNACGAEPFSAELMAAISQTAE